MSRAIDPSNIIPKYYQLANLLREQIENGTWKANETIQSERQLEQQYTSAAPPSGRPSICLTPRATCTASMERHFRFPTQIAKRHS